MEDKELEKYYEDRFTMMTAQGWLDLIEDVEKLQVLTLKQVSEETYKELQNEETI